MANALHNAYLDAMGIQRWELRDQQVETIVVDESVRDDPAYVDSVEDATAVNVKPANLKPAGLKPINQAKSPEEVPIGSDVQHAISWARLLSQVAQCSACDLHQQRSQPVFGVGHQQAQCLVISDAPGVDEDKLGEPIVGAAGTLLNGMLRAIGLSRKTAYITNITKCHSPDNRSLRAEELEACRGYLNQQIALLQPEVILVLGKTAAQSLLDSMEKVGNLRGKVHEYGEHKIPLIVSYHPSYLLRKPLDKRKAWRDLQLAQSAMLTTERDAQ